MKTFYLTFKSIIPVQRAFLKLFWQQCVNWSESKKSMLHVHVGMLGTQASTPQAVETYSKLTQFV